MGSNHSTAAQDARAEHVQAYQAIKRDCNTIRDKYRELLDMHLAGVLPKEKLQPYKEAVMTCNFVQGYWSPEKYTAEMKTIGVELAPDM